MYFPYLRARQFELLALKELVDKELIGEHMMPIIEPIKVTPTLNNTLSAFSKQDKSIAVVMNPTVGDFIAELKRTKDDDKKKINLLREIKKDNIIKAYLINDKTSSYLKGKLNAEELDPKETIIVSEKRGMVSSYLAVFGEEKPFYSLIPDDRKFRRSVTGDSVIFEDRFNKLIRNVDYIDVDEFFSEDHLLYDEEGFKGFSDYSIVGKDFNETGFAPFAVAIHIVYFDEKMSLRIKHFVSDSNEDIKDPAGKFGEALDKLMGWIEEENIFLTKGLEEFKEYYNTGKYPGLGIVKKLSIMHHLELMNRFLEDKYKK